MDDLPRLLDALLHDLRTPLGVASGFVRLVKEGRLPTTADSDRALEKVQEALRSMNALCTNAAEWLQPYDRHPSSAGVRAFVSDVDRRLGEGTLPAVDADAMATLALHLDADEVAQAVSDLLALQRAPAETRPVVQVSVSDGLLRFAVPVGATASTSAFDPWSRPGLVAALACRRILQAGGHWSSTPAEGVLLAITLPIAAAGAA